MTRLPKPSHRQGVFLMVLAPTLWSTAGVLTRHLETAQRFEVTFWRSFFAALFVAFFLIVQHRNYAWSKVRAVGRIGVYSGAMWAVMFCCFMIALMMTTVANILIVLSISPLLTAVFARIFLKVSIPRRTWLAIVVAFVGIVWMFLDAAAQSGAARISGMMVALGVPIAASSNVIMLKKSEGVVDLVPSVFLGGVFSIVLMLPFSLPFQASLNDLGILAALGFFQLGLPCILMVWAARSLAAPEISLLALLEVVLGPLWAWLGAGELPTQATLFGGAVVLGALIFNELLALKK